MTDFVGKTLGKFRLVKQIGEGGMGGVYLGEHLLLSRQVAVKVMHPEFSEKRDAVQRFLLEAQAASAIGHPNIIEVFDIGDTEDGTVYMIMELLEGVVLDELLDLEIKLAPERAVSIILQVLSALNAAHAKDIIHRDLKPANVFLAVDKRDREEVKLLDFGVAKVHGPDVVDTNLTAPGTILGTPTYVSPEQARGANDIDLRIDLWAAGVMLFEMLSGELPFPGDTYNEVLGKVLLEPHPVLQKLVPDTPEALCSVVDRALKKEREERYSSASEMMQDLVHLKGDALSLMTATAAGLIHSSIPPPADRASAREVDRVDKALIDTVDDELGETTEGEPDADVLRTVKSPSLVTSREDTTPVAWQEGTASTRRRSRAGPAVAFGLIGVAAIAALVFLFGPWSVDDLLQGVGLEPADEPSDEPSYEPRVATTGLDSVEVAGSQPAKPAGAVVERARADTAGEEDGVADGGGTMAEADAAVATEADTAGETEGEVDGEPATVTITLEGLPPGAETTIDGQAVDSPISMAASDTPGLLRVTAPGFAPYQMALALDKTQIVEIAMEEATEDKPGKKKGGKKKHKTGGDGAGEFKMWKPKKKSDNPLKNSPFGE